MTYHRVHPDAPETRQRSSPRIAQLARLIEDDIQTRNLEPGDRYRNAAEVARMLKVSTAAANRALQLLAHRSVIERRQRRGTFIGHGRHVSASPILGRIHLLVEREFVQSEGLLGDGVLAGIHEVIPGSRLQFTFMPRDDRPKFVRRLLAETTGARTREGLVIVRSDPGTQQLVADSGLPAVVFGTVWPGISPMREVDLDHLAAGRQVIEHLLTRGGRLAIFLRERMFAGDHELLDAATAAMRDAGRAVDDLYVRALPDEPRVIRRMVEMLVHRPDPFTGFYCHTPLAAEIVHEVAADKPIVLGAYYRRAGGGAARFPYVRAAQSPESIGRIIGRSLFDAAADAAHVPPPPVRLAVSIEIPSGVSNPSDRGEPS